MQIKIIIRLRAMEYNDIDMLYNWENDRSLWHLSGTLKPFSRYVLEQYILNSHLDIFEQKQLRLMIDVEKENCSAVTVGCIDIFDFDPANLRAGIGLYIADNQRGKGIASEALKEVIVYAKNTLHLHQLYCSIITDNEGSIRVFEKAGFVKTGERLQWIRKDTNWANEYFYQLIFT
ncbi:MAG: GNAT family N-acetyltransferase [Bacteroidales bacterium]|nr:GNAT family N-acetyltransferase [Bacteroidales bacterium]